MKRSAINQLIRSATDCFQLHSWSLPPDPKWDVTDFGLGDHEKFGLVLINLAEESEYCEKLMYAKQGMVTPAHCHHRKKEDIIARWGTLKVQVWSGIPQKSQEMSFSLKINGEDQKVVSGQTVELRAGERITLVPHVYHEFQPGSPECIIGEVSTANDDLRDNFFINPDIGRFPGIEEDEAPLVRLLSENDF